MAIELFTAQKILELVFGAIVETGVGKLTEGAMAKLWQAIRQRLQPIAEAEIIEVEQNHSQEALEKLIPLLKQQMQQDPTFAHNIQQLAQSSSQDTITMTGTSHDQSTFKQVGKIQANEVNF